MFDRAGVAIHEVPGGFSKVPIIRVCMQDLLVVPGF